MRCSLLVWDPARVMEKEWDFTVWLMLHRGVGVEFAAATVLIASPRGGVSNCSAPWQMDSYK